MSMIYIADILLFCFSGYFINILPISPVYISYVLSVFILIEYCLTKRKIHINLITAIAIVLMIYIGVTQLVIMTNTNHSVINVLFSLSFIVFGMIGLETIEREKVINLAIKFINLSIPLLVFEAAYRWMNPIVEENNILTGRTYYQYKYNSIMFDDSNYVSIFLLSMFFLSTYLSKYCNASLKKQKLILFVLTLATLSKAAAASLLIFFVLFDLNISRMKKILIIILAAIYGLSEYINLILWDGSLMGKLNIFISMIEYLKRASIVRILFGVGFGQTSKVIYLGGHNLFVTYIVESGVVGTILLVVLWIEFLRFTKYKVGIVMAPIFLAAMSLIGHAIPFVYCTFVIIYMLEHKKPEMFNQIDGNTQSRVMARRKKVKWKR